MSISTPITSCYQLAIDPGAENVAVDWAALMQTQKSDLCIDTRTKVTTGELPNTTRLSKVHNSLRQEQHVTQSAAQDRPPNPHMDQTDAMKLNMWKGKSLYYQLFHNLTYLFQIFTLNNADLTPKQRRWQNPLASMARKPIAIDLIWFETHAQWEEQMFWTVGVFQMVCQFLWSQQDVKVMLVRTRLTSII